MKKFLWLLMIVASHSWADSQPPAANNVVINRTFDRMAGMSSALYIWDDVLGGYDSDDPGKWGRNLWVCESSSNPQYGQCKTSPSSGGGETTIPLLFKEKRSGMKIVLNVTAWQKKAVFSDGAAVCDSLKNHWPIESQVGVICNGAQANGSKITAYLPTAELAKIPVGGLWEAELHLRELTSNGSYLVPFQANLTLNVIDPSHIEIYFPEFSFAAPQLELDLRPEGALDHQMGVVASDITWLDMCLYDGYNANSTQYDVKLQDEGKEAPGRASGDFSIYHTAIAGTDVQHRIDYHVRMQNPETSSLIDVTNGGPIVWTHINEKLIRPVRLPSITYPVLCVPTPLQLSVAKFNVMDKAAGYYKGTLTVIFTPTTPSVD